VSGVVTDRGARRTIVAVRPPGWYPDPDVAPVDVRTGLPAPAMLRWWDGAGWTLHRAHGSAGPVGASASAHVTSAHVTSAHVASAHVDGGRARWHRAGVPDEPLAPLPLGSAISPVVVILVSLVSSRFLLEWVARYGWPIFVYVALTGLVGYGPVLVWCVLHSRRRSSTVIADAGLGTHRSDLWWGPTTWVACFVAQIVLGVIVIVTRIPMVSNTEGIDDLAADRGYVVSLLVLAVVAAPFVEEIVFRGYVLRGLRGSMPLAAALAAQAVLFGVAHVDPVRGWGNLGLVVVLSGVGAVLGIAAHLFRRLGPAIVAHAIINTLAMTLVLSGWGPD
jgi:membrane protease YdiL (CAAX protease family)